jgi:hypothetical protein
MEPRQVDYQDRTCGIDPTRRFRTHKWTAAVVTDRGVDKFGHPYETQRIGCPCGAFRVVTAFPNVLAGVFSAPRMAGAR